MTDDQMKIVNAAIKLFAQKGPIDTSLSDIAKEASVNESLIYRSFSSKDGILLAIYDYFWDRIKNDVEEVYNDEWEPEALGKIRAMAKRCRTFFKDNIDLLKIVNNTYLITQKNSDHESKKDKDKDKDKDEEVENKRKAVWRKNQDVLKILDDTIMAGQERKEITNKMPAPVIRSILMGSFRSLIYGLFIPCITTDKKKAPFSILEAQHAIEFLLDNFSADEKLKHK